MARAGVLIILLGSASLFHGASALRAKKDEGLSDSSTSLDSWGGAAEAIQQADAPDSPPDWGKAIAGAWDWVKKQGEINAAKRQEQKQQEEQQKAAQAAQPTASPQPELSKQAEAGAQAAQPTASPQPELSKQAEAKPAAPMNDAAASAKPEQEKQETPAQASADGAAPKNPFDLGNIIQQAMKPKAPADGAAPKNPFDLGNILQQAMKPKASADGAASKNPFDLGKMVKQAPADGAAPKNPFDLGNVLQQAMKPKAPADGAAPKNPFDIGNIIQQAMKPKAPADGAAPKNPLDIGNIIQQAMKPKASADGAASKNPFDLGKMVQQALQPKAPTDGAAPKNPFDLGNVLQQAMKPKAPADGAAPKNPLDMGNIIQQAMKPKASADGAASKNPFDLGKMVQQALQPKAPADGAAPKNPFDLGNILQQAMKPKAPADGAVPKNPFDFGNIIQHAMKPKAANASASPAPNAGLDSLVGWMKHQQKAAEETAKKSLGNLTKWAWTEVGKAVKAGNEKAQAKPAEPSMNEAKQQLSDAVKGLMDQAKSAATKTAQEHAQKILEQTTQKDDAKAVSKATVDSSIAQAEHHIQAVDSADSATKEAAQKAAHEASQKALRDLLEWSKADEAITSEADEAQTGNNPVRDAWVDAVVAEKKAHTADWIANSIEDITEQAGKEVAEAHTASKAMSRAGIPGATKTALSIAKEVVHQANMTVLGSKRLSAIAAYLKVLLVKAVKAAQKATNPEDFKKAWMAVTRVYGAAGKVQEDALRALTSSRDAMAAVVLSTAEVGWRAVGEVLGAELVLLGKVLSKAAATDAGSRLAAWVEGASQLKPVAEAAWLKGFSQGLQAVAKHDVPGKVKNAAESTASAGAAWVQTIAKVMGSKEARQAVGKAAGSATKAASAAATATASHTIGSLSHAAGDMAKNGQLPFLPRGTSVTATGNWNPHDGYKGEFVGNYVGMDFRSGIQILPNATHDRAVVAGHIQGLDRRTLRATGVAIMGKSTKQSSLAKYAVSESGGLRPPTGNAGTVRADPLNDEIARVQSAGTVSAGDNYAMGALDALVGVDGRAVGKVAGTLKTKQMKKEIKVQKNFMQTKPVLR